MIELSDISKVYGPKTAFTAKKLEIPERECLGVVGNNGAGKTTMLSLILDLIQPTTGVIRSKGYPVASTDAWKSYTGSYLNERFLIPFLTPVEFLEFVGNLHGKNRSDLNLFLSDNARFFNHQSCSGKYIRDLSSGNMNKVGILAALFISPEIVILDEPFANLDPGSQALLRDMLKTLNETGTTLIISSHDLRHITEICTRIIVLDEGSIVRDLKVTDHTLTELEEYFKV